MFDSPDGPIDQKDEKVTLPTSVTQTDMADVAPIPTSNGEVGWQPSSGDEVEMRHRMVKQG